MERVRRLAFRLGEDSVLEELRRVEVVGGLIWEELGGGGGMRRELVELVDGRRWTRRLVRARTHCEGRVGERGRRAWLGVVRMGGRRSLESGELGVMGDGRRAGGRGRGRILQGGRKSERPKRQSHQNREPNVHRTERGGRLLEKVCRRRRGGQKESGKEGRMRVGGSERSVLFSSSRSPLWFPFPPLLIFDVLWMSGE